jgi:hypothetical protein
MQDEDLKRRCAVWLDYWSRALTMQHEEDKDAETQDGPLYVDDVDRAINGIIVASLLERLEGLAQQFAG